MYFVFYGGYGYAYAGPFLTYGEAQSALHTILTGELSYSVVILSLEQIKKDMRVSPHGFRTSTYQYILDVFGDTNE